MPGKPRPINYEPLQNPDVQEECRARIAELLTLVDSYHGLRFEFVEIRKQWRECNNWLKGLFDVPKQKKIPRELTMEMIREWDICSADERRKIYDVFQLSTREYLYRELRMAVPTAEQWASMDKKARRTFTWKGMSLYEIALNIDMEGDPTKSDRTHLKLGRLIYGEEHECLHIKS